MPGALFYNIGDISYYDQTNNAIEQIFRKQGLKSILESCGPESASSCMSSLGYDISGKIQSGDLITMWSNDPKNRIILEKEFSVSQYKYMGNEIIEWYPVIVRELFGVKAEFKKDVTWSDLKVYLSQGNSVQILMSNPGHFQAALWYDEKKDVIIYNDSWPDRSGLKNRGFNETLTEQEFNSKYVKKVVVYYKKET
jgi:hypothetical protein